MSDFIDGIFNYCDRWCERCPLTARCRQFAMEELMTRRDDIQNVEFWKELDLHFPPNPEFEALLADADEEIEDEEDWSSSLDDPFADEDDLFERTQRDPLVKAAFDYATAVRKWFATTSLRHSERQAVKSSNIDRDDALDVIEWYSLQIAAKLARAASGQFELDEDAGYAADIDDESDADDGGLWQGEITASLRDAGRSDRDGSAKVALIGIERSLGALTILRRECPAEEPIIRGLVKQLARLRVQIDQQWPGARTFIRPGFDDEC